MATIREIKRRITAVKSTQKITRAMQMVAAAKLRRAQENILKARPFARMLDNTIAQVAMRAKRDIHPLLAERHEDRKRLLVVVTADSGLCGGFNANTIKAARTYIEEHQGSETTLFCIGRKGRDIFRRMGAPIVGQKVMFFNHLKYADSIEAIARIKELFLNDRYDRVDVIYNEFKSAISQILTQKQLLPLVPAAPEESVTAVDYIYEPDEYAVFDTLIPYHLEIQLWRILLESHAAEMGAKMTAMDAATENANDLLKALTISYNRARQAVITKELSEIVGGAEGLKV
ncbi:ATP synthase F1 subunit gamma [bacterium]|nr:ATP synthase F1 subunit gamma [bacterium]